MDIWLYRFHPTIIAVRFNLRQKMDIVVDQFEISSKMIFLVRRTDYCLTLAISGLTTALCKIFLAAFTSLSKTIPQDVHL